MGGRRRKLTGIGGDEDGGLTDLGVLGGNGGAHGLVGSHEGEDGVDEGLGEHFERLGFLDKVDWRVG